MGNLQALGPDRNYKLKIGGENVCLVVFVCLDREIIKQDQFPL